MADYLKNFAENEIIKASDTNSNNQYLLDRIGDNYTNLKAWLDGEVGRINSNIQSGDATLQAVLDKLQELIESNQSSLYSNITPDYSRGIDIGTTLPLAATPFTAPQDGFYFVNLGQNNATRYLYINGKQAFTYVDGAERTSYQTFFIPVLKGDVLYWDAKAAVKQSTFYPYRGQALIEEAE